MAKRFVSSKETVRIDLGDGDWVDIKARLSYGDRRKASGGMMKVVFNPTSGAVEPIELDIEQQEANLMLVGIVDWNLKDEEGEIAPINKDTVSMLDGETSDRVIAEMNERYRRRGAQERGES